MCAQLFSSLIQRPMQHVTQTTATKVFGIFRLLCSATCHLLKHCSHVTHPLCRRHIPHFIPCVSLTHLIQHLVDVLCVCVFSGVNGFEATLTMSTQN